MPAAREHDEPSIPPGNPPRGRSFVWSGFAALPAFVLMAANRRVPLGLELGTAALFAACIYLLDALGTFDDRGSASASVRLRSLLRPGLALAGSALGLWAALALSVAGVLPAPIATAGVLVTGSALALLAALGWFLERLTASERRFFQREGFWLLALGIALYLPLLGSYSLIDPWETHYGEVAREILARDDWISLWWAQEGWFWSKPVLDFWLQALAFLWLGVNYAPDQMLAGASHGRFPQPEWAARLPGIALCLVSTYIAYRAVARVFGRRAGLYAGILLTTVPYWCLLAHQSMTDMPYVAPLTAALGLVMLGLSSDPRATAPIYELGGAGRTIRISFGHLLLGLVVLSSLPQILYLLSRNLTISLHAAPYVSVHADQFFYGSGGGNCGLPGNEMCDTATPISWLFQPALAAVVWAIFLGVFLFVNRGERRQQRLFFLGAWYATTLAVLAKGAPGLVLPLAITAAGVCATLRFRDFARLELPSFVLLLAAIVLPWYVQAFVRHGPQFTDRLLFYDMYKRAFVHVHDTNSGDDVSFRYYLWQLGYGLFPWTGLCASGFAFTFSAGDEARSRKNEALSFLGLWFVITFAMFTISLTKFHHYILPAVPPLTLVAGILLDRVLPNTSNRPLGTRLRSLFAVALAALGFAIGTSASISGAILGSSSEPSPARPWLSVAALLCGFAGFAWAVRLGPRVEPEATPQKRLESASFGLLCLGSAAAAALVGRDLCDERSIGAARLLNLFSYNYTRAWPKPLDFTPPLFAFALVATLLFAVAVIPRLRTPALGTLLALSCLFSAFLLDAYMLRIAPHWGQRETILAYYERRKSPKELLIAYQMNWKGENFYTGNHIPAFVTSGSKFKDFITAQREAGNRVFFFTTEHSRIGALKAELGSTKKFETLTSTALNNKFVLARAEY